MKKTSFVVGGVFALSLNCYCQLHLNAGDTYIYQFSSLPLVQQFPAEGHFFTASSFVTLNTETLLPGDQLRLEMFENSPADAPFCSTTLFGSGSCFANLGWQDLQGAVRLTMLSGSVQVETIGLEVVTLIPFTPLAGHYYSTITPVPEPSAILLMTLSSAFGAGIQISQWRRAKSP